MERSVKRVLSEENSSKKVAAISFDLFDNGHGVIKIPLSQTQSIFIKAEPQTKHILTVSYA